MNENCDYHKRNTSVVICDTDIPQRLTKSLSLAIIIFILCNIDLTLTKQDDWILDIFRRCALLVLQFTAKANNSCKVYQYTNVFGRLNFFNL